MKNLIIFSILLVIINIFVTLTNSANSDESMHPYPHDNPQYSTLDIDEKEMDSAYWLEKGKTFTQNQKNRKINNNIAKNVIFFIGDGMSLTTLAATRMYLGGEEKSLSFENFPYTGLAKTYCLDRMVPDSGCTATAFLSGVKANYGTIGVNGKVIRRNCDDALNKSKFTSSIGDWALESGKKIGFVTTTRVTHATPAGLYAHTPDKNWENDAEVKEHCGENFVIPDIAQQLITSDTGGKISVIMGGGRTQFLPQNINDEDGNPGLRTDDKNLIGIWDAIGEENKENRTYISNKDQLNKIKPSETEKLLGLFNDDNMMYHLEDENNTMPTLAEMTEKAIEILQANSDKGYFLFVESGLIDIAHHKVYSRLAFDETAELSKAIDIAKKLTKDDDTLIVVSADHSHTMAIAGYPKRHNNIFDAAQNSDVDKLPYLTLNYANGAGFKDYFDPLTNKRKDPTTVDRSQIRAKFPSTINLNYETHGGEDVGVFATGPQAHLFTGVYEQNLLPHLMAYASCIGNGPKACEKS